MRSYKAARQLADAAIDRMWQHEADNPEPEPVGYEAAHLSPEEARTLEEERDYWRQNL